MAKKAAVKKSRKQIEDEKRTRWLKIGLALLVAVIMVSVTLSYLINPAKINPGYNNETTTFGSIVDVASMLRPNAQYVRFADLNANGAIRSWAETYIGSNLGNTTLLGAKELRKDALATFPFPTLGYISENTQVIVLSDFGTGFDNASYPLTTISGVPIREVVKGVYGFSKGIYPVFSGREDYVASAVIFASRSTAAASAYTTYVDLFDQADSINHSARAARFAVIGDNINATFGGDRYYAGITPLNDTASSYQIIVHLKAPLNETYQQQITGRLTNASALFGLYAYTTRYTDNYMFVDAQGNTTDCLDDLLINWQGIRDASYYG